MPNIRNTILKSIDEDVGTRMAPKASAGKWKLPKGVDESHQDEWDRTMDRSFEEGRQADEKFKDRRLLSFSEEDARKFYLKHKRKIKAGAAAAATVAAAKKYSE